MLYSQVLETVRPLAGAWSAEVPQDWTQGRTVWGGLQAALALRAMRGLVPQAVPLRVLQTTFVAPVPAGRLRIEAKVLRRGRSVTHAEARLIDRDQTACLVIGIFGESRRSAIEVRPSKPQVPPAEAAALMPYREGVLPLFARQVSMRWAQGVTLYQGAPEPKTQIYVGFHDEPYAGHCALGEAQIVGYADISPSPGLSLLTQPAVASSLTWTLELLSDDLGPACEGLWLMDTSVDSGRDGYLNQSALLWSPEWRPVALSRQSVAVFA